MVFSFILLGLTIQGKLVLHERAESSIFQHKYGMETTCKLQICSWNIRLLLENSGGICICWYHCAVTSDEFKGYKVESFSG